MYLIYKIWSDWVLWYINHCREFNAKFCFYIYIEYMICKHIFRYTRLNDQTVLFLTNQFSIKVNKVKWFQVLIYISNNSNKHRSFVNTELNSQTVLFLTIQFSIKFNKVKWFQVLIYISNNLNKHQSFVNTELNHQTVLFLTIQFSILQSCSITGASSSDAMSRTLVGEGLTPLKRCSSCRSKRIRNPATLLHSLSD